MKKGKVLFLYPNSEGLGGIPNGIALLSSCLKNAGFETKCFDTTFDNSPPLTHYNRATHGFFNYADPSNVWGKWDPKLKKSIPDRLLSTIAEFKPDLIAVSCLEVNVNYVLSLLRIVKEHYAIPTLIGGITCIASPELLLSSQYVDMVCAGEGEEAIVEVANCIVNQQIPLVRNVLVKWEDNVIRTKFRPLFDMDSLPFPDWTIFDKRHYYKPYCGKFHRTAFVEMARGCHFACTYCITNMLRKLYKDLGSFMRTRNVDRVLDEICYLHKLYDLELIFLTDDDFLGMPEKRFDYFCKEYKKRVNLPFYIQTRSETIREDYIKKLKYINISTIAIGVEHGNEAFRKKYMNRMMSNASIKKAFDIVNKYNIRTTANIIIGMPYETELMMKDTINLLRDIKPSSVSINYFTPYRGTDMRAMAVSDNIIPEDYVIKETHQCLNMPQFKAEKIKHYYENLKKYIDGELEFSII
jgi:radical SAM superfamily enzyme YgiQ (UPF0313 family)